MLDLVMSEFHQNAVGSSVGNLKERCALTDTQCETGNASRVNVDPIGRSRP